MQVFFRKVEAGYNDPQIIAQGKAATPQDQQQLNYVDVDFNGPPPGKPAPKDDGGGTTCFCFPKRGKAKGGKAKRNPYNSQEAYAEIAIQEQQRK